MSATSHSYDSIVEMPNEKRPFLVAYDYGMGGLWGVMLARSEDEIRDRYPELGVARTRPAWMSDERYDQLYEEELHDIDGAPWGIIDGSSNLSGHLVGRS